ncbi:hypothetical protein BGY98DRAFT_1021348 [Russula aff. rugulosa BPL654]|nr:hypothetical protein BGY98DRAFT_1021348 [Russula aff. rugulosa BPL654]
MFLSLICIVWFYFRHINLISSGTLRSIKLRFGVVILGRSSGIYLCSTHKACSSNIGTYCNLKSLLSVATTSISKDRQIKSTQRSCSPHTTMLMITYNDGPMNSEFLDVYRMAVCTSHS